MKRFGRLFLCVASLALVCGWFASSPAGAIPPEAPAGSGGSSCVWAIEGDDGTGNFTWAAGATHTVHFKCYYRVWPCYGSGTGCDNTAFSHNWPLVHPNSGSSRIGLYVNSTGGTVASGDRCGSTGNMVLNSYTLTEPTPGYQVISLNCTRSGAAGNLTFRSTNRLMQFTLSGTSPDTRSAGTYAPTYTSTSGLVESPRVGWSGFGAAEPTYRWGAGHLESACLTTTFSVTPSGSQPGGSSVSMTAVWDVENEPYSVDVRFPGRIAWVPFVAAGTATGTGYTASVASGDGGSYLPGAIEVRCVAEEDGEPLYNTVDEGDWETEAAERGPCSTAELVWPRNKVYDDGDPLTWTFTYDTSLGAVTALDYFTYDYMDDEAVLPSYSAASWTTTGAALDGDDSFTINAAFDGPPAQFVFRCQDVDGYYFAGTLRAGYAYDTSGDDEGRDCYGSIGIGLRPSSWVPGLLRGTGCVLRTLFEPSESQVDAFKSEASAVSERAPVSYIVEPVEVLTDVFADAPSNVLAHDGDCVEMMPDLSYDDVEFGAVEMCPETVGGAWAPFRVIIAGLSWLAAFWLLWTATRRLVAA